jgi:hypothetical protein
MNKKLYIQPQAKIKAMTGAESMMAASDLNNKPGNGVQLGKQATYTEDAEVPITPKSVWDD